jgi:hypothetical protein
VSISGHVPSGRQSRRNVMMTFIRVYRRDLQGPSRRLALQR